MNWLILATEDELSEQVAIYLAREAGWEVGQCLRRGGNGYLRSRLSNFSEMASQRPLLVITDLDQMACAPALLADWFGKRLRPQNLLLRVAVREIESWLLADHDAIRLLIGRKVGRIPVEPDCLPDPKSTLLALAQHASRQVRDELVAWQGQKIRQGLGYNATLTQWLREHWSPERAASRSPSLHRARIRLRELVV